MRAGASAFRLRAFLCFGIERSPTNRAGHFLLVFSLMFFLIDPIILLLLCGAESVCLAMPKAEARERRAALLCWRSVPTLAASLHTTLTVVHPIPRVIAVPCPISPACISRSLLLPATSPQHGTTARGMAATLFPAATTAGSL